MPQEGHLRPPNDSQLPKGSHKLCLVQSIKQENGPLSVDRDSNRLTAELLCSLENSIVEEFERRMRNGGGGERKKKNLRKKKNFLLQVIPSILLAQHLGVEPHGCENNFNSSSFDHLLF